MFEDLPKEFENQFRLFDPVNNSVSVKKYFGEGMGIANALFQLNSANIINSEKDFKGIYVFLKSGKPFYIGISKNVIRRIIQHVKGTSHFTSSLCYKLGADRHVKLNGEKHSGGRKGLDFPKYAEPAKKELIQCNIAMFPVKEDIELYLFEVFVAMKLGTLNYNEFKTH